MKRLIVDMSSVTWRGLLAGNDVEFGYTVQHEGKEVKIASAQFGYENVMNAILGPMKHLGIVPMNVILVIEGKESKAYRRSKLPTYKEGSTRAPEAYDEFAKCIQLVKNAFLAVGAKACSQPHIESDDVIAHLAQTLDGEKIILSEDGDLTILIMDEAVIQKSSACGTSDLVSPPIKRDSVKLWRKGELTDQNPYGPFPLKYITLYKALVGDSSDNIKGAFRFGEKAFLDLYVKFGDEGLDALEAMITCPNTKRESMGLGLLAEDVPEFKPLQRIIDSADEVYASYQAAKLYPDQIDTRRKPLSWEVGMVKAATPATDERLSPYAGRVRLVHADNYDQALAWALPKILESEFVALDIETSTPPESDQWVEDNKKKSGEKIVDVFGSELTGMGLTFGNNSQYTLYFTVDHVEEPGIRNITSEQCRKAVELCFGRPIVIQNVSFELTVLYQAWAEAWKDDPEWHGFIPNTHDTKIMGSYVNENISNGLKGMSKHYLGYDQQTYAEVTQYEGEIGTLPKGGVQVKAWDVLKTESKPFTIVNEDTGEETSGVKSVNVLDAEGNPIVLKHMEQREYKMNELTANHVLHYGSDDTICTAALYSHFRLMMERESTWQVYLDVEIYPAYLTALAFVQGADISITRLNEIIAEDEKIEQEARAKLDALLVEYGWDDHALELFTEWSPAAAKAAFLAQYGMKLDSAVRTPAKLAAIIEEKYADLPGIDIFAGAVARSDVASMNAAIKTAFMKKPNLDLDSPKVMKKFLYDFVEVPVRIINDATDTERAKQPDLVMAIKAHKALNAGRSTIELTEEQKTLIKAKAKTDDTAIEFALLYDADDVSRPLLKLVQTLKTVGTRRKLYYNTYPSVPHWKDGKVHSNMNQCQTVTRRYSSSGPNLTQLPKMGNGVKFRSIFVPHKANAVFCSIDFSGQELRLMAGQSLDPNMMACYVGKKLKDIHNITASGAMRRKLGDKKVDELLVQYAEDISKEDAEYDLFTKIHSLGKSDPMGKEFDDIRKNAKNTNFASQFGAMAPKLAEMLIMTVEDAQTFLDAKNAMFPEVLTWGANVCQDLESKGYVTTMLGARRHLREALASAEHGVADKAKRQGPNFKIQSSAAEMTKLSMGVAWKSGIFHTHDVRFVAPIHDELCWVTSIEDFYDSVRVIHEAMTRPYSDLPVPIVGSISVGDNFADQVELGNEVSIQSFIKALKKFLVKTQSKNLSTLIDVLSSADA